MIKDASDGEEWGTYSERYSLVQECLPQLQELKRELGIA